FTVSGRNYSFAIDADGVGSDTTLAGLAAALAFAVNADAALPDYLAIAIDDTVVLTDRAATPVRPTIALSVGLNAGGMGGAIGANDQTSSVSLSLAGTPVLGETWTVTLGATTYSVLVGATINLGSG